MASNSENGLCEQFSVLEVENSSESEFIKLKNEGNVLFKQQKFLEALEKYNEAFEKTKNDQEKAAVFHNRGASYEGLNEKELALQQYNEAINLNPEYYKGFKRRAKLYFQLSRYEDAKTDVQKIVEIEIQNREFKPDSMELLTSLLVVLGERMAVESMGNIAKCPKPPRIEDVNIYLRSFVCDPVSQLWAGKLSITPSGDAEANNRGYLAAVKALQEHNYDAIIDLCSEEIENPNSEHIAAAHLLRGTFKFLWGYSQETLEDFDAVINDPKITNKMKSSAALKSALFYLHRTLDSENIEKYFEKAETLYKDNGDVYHHCAVMLIDRKQPAEADIVLKKAVSCIPEEEYPVFFQVFQLSMKYYFCDEEKNTDEYIGTQMVSALKEMESRFDSPECYDVYSNVLLLQGKIKDAEELFDKAISKFPSFPSFRVKKILTHYTDAEDHTDCIKELTKFLEIDGGYNILYYHLGMLHLSQHNYEAGLEYLSKSFALARNIGEAVQRAVTLAEYQFHLAIGQKLGIRAWV